MALLCLALVVVAFAISCPLIGWLIGFSRRHGLVDEPGTQGHKKHAVAVPGTGGIGIFWAILLPIAAVLGAAWWMPATSWSGALAPVAAHVEGLRRQTPMALGLIGGLVVMHVLGLIDDRKRLGPYSKLVVQLLVAGGLAAFFDFRIFEFLDRWGSAGFIASVALSVCWIVTITNAMNFLDNMDGLAGGVGAVVAALYLAVTLLAGQWFVAALTALLLGALLGFLVFNFPPAKIFMGDGGSLVLGLLLAVISIRTTYLAAPGSDGHVPWYGVFMPLMVMAVPLYDFTSVTVLRMMRGRSPFKGDHNHFSHRLVRRGLSRRNAVLLIWLCTLATGVSGLLLGSLTSWQAMLAAAQTVAILAVLAVLESAGGTFE
jgi:UDP-GlcNAc:undecaprenyl-phosphate GlcNAc-1-phosphate transferase